MKHQLEATRVTKEVVSVEVEEYVLFQRVYDIAKERLRPRDIPREAHLNLDGEWATWHPDHGSGTTEVHRKATRNEVEHDLNLRQLKQTLDLLSGLHPKEPAR